MAGQSGIGALSYRRFLLTFRREVLYNTGHGRPYGFSPTK